MLPISEFGGLSTCSKRVQRSGVSDDGGMFLCKMTREAGPVVRPRRHCGSHSLSLSPAWECTDLLNVPELTIGYSNILKDSFQLSILDIRIPKLQCYGMG